MRYLIDTQILIWTMAQPEKLTAKTQQILENHAIFVSHISLFVALLNKK